MSVQQVYITPVLNLMQTAFFLTLQLNYQPTRAYVMIRTIIQISTTLYCNLFWLLKNNSSYEINELQTSFKLIQIYLNHTYFTIYLDRLFVSLASLACIYKIAILP